MERISNSNLKDSDINSDFSKMRRAAINTIKVLKALYVKEQSLFQNDKNNSLLFDSMMKEQEFICKVCFERIKKDL